MSRLGLPYEIDSLRRFGREVMPQFERRRAAG